MIGVESAGLTDVGKKRKGNEDSFFVDDALKLYIVADGMGGHLAGEVASNLVVETMRDYMKRFNGGEEVEELSDADDTLSKDANRLAAGIHLSNKVVFQSSARKKSYKGMGSTVSAVYFTSDDTCIAGNVGDSPIYLIRKGKIERLSVTHTVYEEQMVLNPNGPHQFGKEFSHVLTRAIGVEDAVKPDLSEIQCFKDDILVLASDGLSDKVSMEETRKIAATHRPEKACKALVDLANERGGDDNITVVALRVKSVNDKKRGIWRFLSWFLK